MKTEVNAKFKEANTIKEITSMDLCEYVRYLCKKYNELSEKIALAKAGAYVEIPSVEKAVTKEHTISNIVYEICEMLEVKPPEREEIEGSTCPWVEKYTYSYYAFVDYKNWHISPN